MSVGGGLSLPASLHEKGRAGTSPAPTALQPALNFSIEQTLLNFRRGLPRRAALLLRRVLREVFGVEAEVAQDGGELLRAVHGDDPLRAALAREADEVVEVRVVGEREQEVCAAVH